MVTEAVDFFFIPPDAPHQPINLSELRTVMDAVDDFCGRHQVDIAVNRRLNVVLDDLLANVIAYGFDDGQMLLGCPAYNLVRIRSLNAWLDERHT